MDFKKEDEKRQAALAKEQARASAKESKRKEMMSMTSYRCMSATAKYMDKWCLDPVIGLLPFGIGDTLSSVLALPFIYYSLCVVKSIPLTLAVIYNVLKDILLGAIPFFIGDIFDFFHRSYLENLRLITGYINDDKEIIKTVNQKAFKTAILIALVCWLIYLVISWAISLGHWIGSLF